MGISVTQLLIIFAIILLLFGTKKLRNLGSDLGGAIKGFKKAMSDEEKQAENPTGQIENQAAKPTAENTATKPGVQPTHKETH